MAEDPDFAILCAVQEAPLDGPAVWARRTGIDATTLRRRLRRLEDNGVLRGFAATPAAAAYGRTPTTMAFQTPHPPSMEQILAIEDVAWAATSYDDRTWVNVYEGSDRAPELEALLGPSVTRYVAAGEPEPTVLGRLEMRVLRALIQAPRAGIQQLTEMTGLSAKTVRNHRAALIARRLVRVDPLLRPPRAAGRMYYHVTLRHDGNLTGQALAAVPEAFVISQYNEGRDLYMFCAAAGLQEQAERVEALRRMPGVTDATVVVTREYGLATTRLLRWCDEAIAVWG